MVTDPISDFIIRLQNASRTNKASVSLPFSKMKLAIAEVLSREGYIGTVGNNSKTAHTLSVDLKYKNGKPLISGVKRISKPSRRMYLSVKELRPVKRGHGLLVLSTPAGVVSGKQAREQKVGGEALFEIW